MLIQSDFIRNRKNLKGLLFLVSFRLSHAIRLNPILLILFFPIPVFHTILFNWLMGYDIPLKTKLGKGLIIYHGNGLVINADVVIGENCVLRHSTTIGNKVNSNGVESASPVIGNRCEIGAHVVIIGPVRIGDNVSIGAGTIVTKDIPDNSIVYGSPLIIKRNNETIVDK